MFEPLTVFSSCTSFTPANGTQEVPTTASAYVDSALKPLQQLQSGHRDTLQPAVVRQWLEGALAESTHKWVATGRPGSGGGRSSEGGG